MLVTGKCSPRTCRPRPAGRGPRAARLSRMLPREAYVDTGCSPGSRALLHRLGLRGPGHRRPDGCGKRAVSLGGAGVLLTRAEDGVLRAFANVCRHRGHELLPCGSARASGHRLPVPRLVLPARRLAARCAGASATSRASTPTQFGLIELPPAGVARLGLRRHLRGAGTSPSTSARWRASSRPTGRQPGALATHEYEIAANWKIIVENYQECYHCSMIHPELCRSARPRAARTSTCAGDWVGGWMALRDEADTMSLDGRSAGVVIEGLDATEQRTVMYIAMFPNLLISLHPDYVMTHRLTPLAADRDLRSSAPGSSPRGRRARGFDPAYAVDFWDLTNRQDWAACESVQRGPVQRARGARPAGPRGGRRAAVRHPRRPRPTRAPLA